VRNSSEWDPAFLNGSPMFEPLRFYGEHLPKTAWPTVDDLNRLIRFGGEIFSHSNAAIHFVNQASSPSAFAERYEPKIYLQGAVSTRSGNWHDLFNALVWLTFPKTKAAINKRHYFELKRQEINQEKNRGPLQDLLTLFDESGAVVVCADSELAGLLKNAKWKELFWQRRQQVILQMQFYLFGHALYEKALRPYRGMTGKIFILMVENNFFTKAVKQKIEAVDLLLAELILSKELSELKREFFPLPLLGVPGWTVENETEIYYDDKSYFR
jgi:hypothetical protein